MSKVRDLPETTLLEDSDLVYAVDVSEGPNGGRKITKANLKESVKQSPSEVKTAYESNSNTNAFTDAEKAKLAGIEDGAVAEQNALEVPYDNSESGISATNVKDAIDELSVITQADFRPTVVSGRVLHYTGGTVRFDDVFYSILGGDILLDQNVTNGEVYVDLDGIVKQTGSGTTAPPLTIVFAKFSTDLNVILSLSDQRVKNTQNLVRGILADVRDVRAGAASQSGASGRLSDAMHKHSILTGAASAQAPDQANAEGTSANLARADHVHNIPTATAVDLSPASVSGQGASTSFARADHTHAIATGITGDMSTITSDSVAAAGTADRFARADHVHAVATGAASAQAPDQANAAGSSANLARADHVHNIPTATATGLGATSANTQGVSTSFSRADHTHAIASAAAVTQNPDQANAVGSSASFARADHVHQIPTAVASSLSTSSTNTQGVSTSFARADHTHAVSITAAEVTATVDDTTTSTTDVLMVSMTNTPAAGSYRVTWDGSIVNSGNGAERTFISVYVGGVQVSASERSLGTSGGAYNHVALGVNVSVNGSQAIEIRWRVAGGTSTVRQRRLSLLRLSN